MILSGKLSSVAGGHWGFSWQQKQHHYHDRHHYTHCHHHSPCDHHHPATWKDCCEQLRPLRLGTKGSDSVAATLSLSSPLSLSSSSSSSSCWFWCWWCCWWRWWWWCWWWWCWWSWWWCWCCWCWWHGFSSSSKAIRAAELVQFPSSDIAMQRKFGSTMLTQHIIIIIIFIWEHFWGQ